MKFRLSPQICEKIPGIQVSVLVFKNLQNLRKISTVEQLLRGVYAQRKSEWKNEENSKQISEIIKKTQVDGQMLPEAQLFESTIRKIKRGKPPIGDNNLQSIAHYLSMKYIVPLMCYDLDEVEKDLEIEFITPKRGKKAASIEVEKETRNIVLWIIDVGSQSKDEFLALPHQLAEIIQKYCGGTQPEIHLLNCENTDVDLEYISEKEREYTDSNPEPIEAVKDDKPKVETASEEISSGKKPIEALTTEKEVAPEAEAAMQAKLQRSILEAIKKLDMSIQQEIEIETPADTQHGDYSTNIALKLSKEMDKAPQELAQIIIDALSPLDIIEKVEIAGPGFINFHLSQNFLVGEIEEILKLRGQFGRIETGKGKKALIEYSSPNIAKPLGVHHLLSTIIGQAIADLHRAAGYEVVTLNYLGDWGTQFGKLLYAYKNWGNEEEVKKDPLNELLKLYVRFHDEAEKDPGLVDKGREEFKKLEEGDEENLKLWEWFREVSIEEIERIYKKLGVHFDTYVGERMYLEAAQKILAEGKNKGVFMEGEKGAIIVKFEGDKYPPYMVQKADGTTLYATRDLAMIRERIHEYHPAKIVHVVDVAQKLYFQQMFETARKLGIEGAESVHVSFGRMQLPEGKMSTRKGEVVLLDEVLKEAIARTEKIVEEKSRELSPEERKHVAEGMAIGAIKYNIFSQNRETNITFDWDKMLSLEGNSGPYIQYAYARARSILRNAQLPKESTGKPGPKGENQTSLFGAEEEQKTEEEKEIHPYEHKTEQALLHLLRRFPEKIEVAARDYKPNIVTSYLYDIARAFSSFYSEVHVLSASKPELREARLKLVQATAQILENGLRLLGIETFEQM